jgi:membrane-associated protease RseP (regulator of RpoE activity)
MNHTLAVKKEIDKCPKTYVKWLFVVLGMVFVFICYLIYSNITGSNAYFDEVTSAMPDQNLSQAPIITARADNEDSSSSVFLGVEAAPLDPVIAEQLKISGKSGVLINNVIPDSSAYEAGLKRGDLIISLNNRTVKDMDRFRQIMGELSPGDRVRIVYMREARKASTYAVLGELAAFQKTAQTAYSPDLDVFPFLGISLEQTERADWGMSLSPLSSTLRESFNIPSGIDGVVVVSVREDGLADRAGLMPGDVITGIDRTAIAGMDDFFRAVLSDRDTTALLDIYSQGGMRYLPLDSSGIKASDQTQTQETTTLRQRLFSIFTQGSSSEKNLILTEHVNEEDDYEKPVCKRLEESGERYNQQDSASEGKI